MALAGTVPNQLTKTTANNYRHKCVIFTVTRSSFFVYFSSKQSNSDYLKRKISGVSEFKLK